MMARYTYGHRHSSTESYWYIQDMGNKGYASFDDPIVFKLPFLEEHWKLDVPPKEFRDKYEELSGRAEFDVVNEEKNANIVELIADEDDCAWDQPCAFGYRVESHAVYCHNDKWLYAPYKCRRGSDDYPHNTCRGYKANPLLKSCQ